MPKPLMPTPLNNHLLVKIEREYKNVVRSQEDEQMKRGVVIDVGLSASHLTAMTGFEIPSIMEYAELYQGLKGKTVIWSEGAEAGTDIKIDGEDYAFVPFWRLIGYYGGGE